MRAVKGSLGRSPWEKLEQRKGCGLVVLLLAERARSECARSMRAIEDRPGACIAGGFFRHPVMMLTS